MQEDTFEDEKEEILKELGFDADYKLSDELTAAIKAYYVPAVEALENENVMDLIIALRYGTTPLEFLKQLPISKLSEVITCLKSILNKSYWNLEK